MRAIFQEVGHIDYAFANAGVSEETNYFADQFDSDGLLVEPAYAVLDVNLRGVYNVVKLAWSQMRADKTHGSIVITTSATAYSPEQSLPVYSSGKLAVSASLAGDIQPRVGIHSKITHTNQASVRFSLLDSSGHYGRASSGTASPLTASRRRLPLRACYRPTWPLRFARKVCPSAVPTLWA